MKAKVKGTDLIGTFLEVQWLRLLTPNARGMGSVPHQETKILHALGEAKKKTNKQTKNKVLAILN